MHFSPLLGDAVALQWARRIYDFWASYFVLPSGQVYDHEAPDGSKVGWTFSYNQGIMLQAAAALASATGNTTYCTTADPVVKVCHHRAGLLSSLPRVAFLCNFSSSILNPPPVFFIHYASFSKFLAANLTSASGVLYDGDAQHCTGDCALFKGITVRGLVAFARVCGSSTARALAQTSVAGLWHNARNKDRTTFSADWDGPPPNDTSDAPLGNAISATAALGSLNYSDALGMKAASSVTYEAEEGLLRSLGLEAAYGNYSGWGYVAGWRSAKQSVTFVLDPPSKRGFVLVHQTVVFDDVPPT